MNPNANFELIVKNADLASVIRIVQRSSPATAQSAVLTYDGEALEIAFGASDFRIPAAGTWHGEVVVPTEFFKRLLPPEDKDGQTSISTDGQRVKIGAISVSCQWNGFQYPRITVPLGSSLAYLAALPLRYSSTDIERSNLTKKVDEAKKAVQDAATKLSELATKSIGKTDRKGEYTFSISPAEFEEFLWHRISTLIKTD